MIVPLPQSSLPKMFASMECWEESNWIWEIQTKVLMIATLCPLRLWMGILNNGRVTLVELVIGGSRGSQDFRHCGEGNVDKVGEVGWCSVGPSCLTECRFPKFLWSTYEWKPQPSQVYMQRERPIHCSFRHLLDRDLACSNYRIGFAWPIVFPEFFLSIN